MTGSGITPNGARLDQIFGGLRQDFVRTPPQEGEISKAPAKDGDPCFVQIHVGDTVDELGPCPYMLRGTALPKKGERCLLLTSNFGQPWIAAFWPYA